MLGKIILSDEEYRRLTIGILLGVGIGSLVGMFLKNNNSVQFFFVLGGVIGILNSSIYSLYRRKKEER